MELLCFTVTRPLRNVVSIVQWQELFVSSLFLLVTVTYGVNARGSANSAKNRLSLESADRNIIDSIKMKR